MKAAVITFVRAYNYGAILQCYALCHKMKQIGFDVEVIDYYPEHFKKIYTFSYLGKLRYFPPYRPIKNWIKFSKVKRILSKRNKNFERFIEKYIPLTSKQYFSIDDMNKENFDHDMFVSGSDQVWNDRCSKLDPTFFLQFDSCRDSLKVSYAASFGFSEIPSDKESDYQKLLSGWDKYSVREESGVNILKTLIGVDAEVCCDPTLLLSKDEWKTLCHNKGKKEPYILVYTVDSARPSLIEYSKKLSKEKGMKVIFLCCGDTCEKIVGYDVKNSGGEMFGTASPSDFVSMFVNAEYVLTDSFHGTVFSVINHKKFMVIADYSFGTNVRAKNLLSFLGIEERILCDNMDDIGKAVDWKDVDNRIEEIKNKSIGYLKGLKSLGHE